MDEIGWRLNLTRRASSLSIAEQQLVEILRGLLRHARILILDEPTIALSFDEVGSRFKCVGDLKSKGIGIIYITHRLTEVSPIRRRGSSFKTRPTNKKCSAQEDRKRRHSPEAMPPCAARKARTLGWGSGPFGADPPPYYSEKSGRQQMIWGRIPHTQSGKVCVRRSPAEAAASSLNPPLS